MELEKTDQEQVEELQKWWHENRFSLLGGIALGIAALVGWERWQIHDAGTQMAASDQYEAVVEAVSLGKAAQADAALATLQEDHAGSVYLVHAHLARAKLASQDEDWTAVSKHLSAALDSGPEPALVELVRMRLARAQWGAGQADAALTTLDAIAAESYQAQVLELRGDIELSRGNNEAARAAYEEARTLLAATPGGAPTLDSKLARLGASAS